MKQLIIILLVTMFTIMVATECSNRYPNVRIDIGSTYEYVDYDVITTDSGKDVVVHFKLKEE